MKLGCFSVVWKDIYWWDTGYGPSLKTSQTFVDSSSASAQGLYFGSVLQDRVYVLSNALIAHWFAFEDRQLGLWVIGVLHYGMVILTF